MLWNRKKYTFLNPKLRLNEWTEWIKACNKDFRFYSPTVKEPLFNILSLWKAYVVKQEKYKELAIYWQSEKTKTIIS